MACDYELVAGVGGCGGGEGGEDAGAGVEPAVVAVGGGLVSAFEMGA